MNWDTIEANWKELKGKAKSRWGELTDDDLKEIDGKQDKLLGKLQERYGTAKEKLEREMEDWGRSTARGRDTRR